MAREGDEGGRQVNAGLVGAALVAVLLAIFIFQNTDEQNVKVYFWDFTGPLWVILLATALVTLVLAELVTLVRRRRR
jgi:uncharacterized integral membrane protein